MFESNLKVFARETDFARDCTFNLTMTTVLRPRIMFYGVGDVPVKYNTVIGN
jgi:hypothetical protein